MKHLVEANQLYRYNQRIAKHVDIANLFNDGASISDMAKSIGRGPVFIKSCLRDLGLLDRALERANEIKSQKSKDYFSRARANIAQDVSDLYREGLSIIAMADRLGVSRTMITSCIDDLGLRRRTGSEANKIRMAKLTSDERKSLARAANQKAHNRKRSEAQMASQAFKKQASGCYVGMFERDVAEALRQHGLAVVEQAAWNRYNIDIMIGHLAVEIHSRSIRPVHCSGDLRKTCDLLRAGKSVIYVWLTGKRPPTNLALEQIIAFHEITSRDPSPLGQYRVIRSNGEIDTASNDYLDDFAAVMADYHALKSGG